MHSEPEARQVVQFETGMQPRDRVSRGLQGGEVHVDREGTEGDRLCGCSDGQSRERKRAYGRPVESMRDSDAITTSVQVVIGWAEFLESGEAPHSAMRAPERPLTGHPGAAAEIG